MKTSHLALAANLGGALYSSHSARPAFCAGNLFPSRIKRSLARLAWLPLIPACSLASAFAAIAPSLNLAWNANPESDIASYEVSYGLSTGNYSSVVNVGANTTATLSGLTEGKTYFFVVAAYNQAGLKSTPSPEISQWISVTPTDYLSPSGWTLKYVDSQEAADYPATFAFDGNPSTFWHTQFRGTTPQPPPHDLQINLGSVQNLKGFRYLPRQDGFLVGNIGQFEFYVSTDGTTWGEPVTSGSFANTSAEKEILFPPKSGQFIRMRAITAANGGTECSIAELKVLQQIGDVSPNPPPVVAGKTVTTAEDSSVAVNLAGTDSLANSLTYSIVSNPTRGTLSGTAPNLTYSPSADFYGSDSFTFKVNNGSADSAAATVAITVTPVNDPPTALAKSLSTAEDTALSVTLAGSDKDGNPLTYSVVTNPANGTLSGTPPNLSYLPAANFSGSDSFTFRVSDGGENPATATISITVTPVNDAPVAISRTIATAQNTSASVTLEGSDAEGTVLTYTLLTHPANGALTGTAPKLTYIPITGFSGTDLFTYQVNDGTTNSATATITLNVAKKILTPGVTLIPQSGWTLKYADSEESLDYPATSAFDGNPLTFWHTQWRVTPLAPPPHEIQINLGTVKTINGFLYLPRQDIHFVGNIGQYEFYVSTDGIDWGSPVATGTFANTKDEKEIIFTPKSGQYVRLRELTEANGGNECAVAEINLLQGSVTNQVPTAVTQSLTTLEDKPLEITLAGNDEEGAKLNFSIISGPAHGQLKGTPPNLTYVPAADFNGQDSFTFLANDGTNNSTPANVAITVTPVDETAANTAPVFTPNRILASATEDQTFTGQLAATDENPGDTLVYAKVSGPQWLAVSPSGEISGIPRAANVGANEFVVKVTDPSNASATAALIITVKGKNNAPVFKANPMLFPAGSETVVYANQTLAGSATDAGDSITYSRISGPEWLTISNTGLLGGTPPAGSEGIQQFTVRATDAAGAFSQAVLQIEIRENSLPLPWSVDRFGEKNLAGTAEYTGGTFALTGAGAPTKTTDSGNFVWQTLSGDGEISARVNNYDGTTEALLVGLMVRESLAPNARVAFVGVSGDGKYRWNRRSATGGSLSTNSEKNKTPSGIWLRLVRAGGILTAYRSADGSNWQKLGSDKKLVLPDNCYIGLSVSSGNNTKLNSSTFSNVSVTP